MFFYDSSLLKYEYNNMKESIFTGVVVIIEHRDFYKITNILSNFFNDIFINTQLGDEIKGNE